MPWHSYVTAVALTQERGTAILVGKSENVCCCLYRWPAAVNLRVTQAAQSTADTIWCLHLPTPDTTLSTSTPYQTISCNFGLPALPQIAEGRYQQQQQQQLLQAEERCEPVCYTTFVGRGLNVILVQQYHNCSMLLVWCGFVFVTTA